MSKIALPNCEVGYKERKVKKISKFQGMDRGVRGATMRHSHAEANKVADRLPELPVEQIQLPIKGRMSSSREDVKKN